RPTRPTHRLPHALRDELLVDVVAEIAPGRTRAREPPPDLGRDARVLEGPRCEFDDELARALVVAGGPQAAALQGLHLHRAPPVASSLGAGVDLAPSAAAGQYGRAGLP